MPPVAEAIAPARAASAPVKAPFAWPNRSELTSASSAAASDSARNVAAAPRREVVNVPSEHGFPAPALALEQDARVVVRGVAAQLRQRVAHGRGALSNMYGGRRRR